MFGGAAQMCRTSATEKPFTLAAVQTSWDQNGTAKVSSGLSGNNWRRRFNVRTGVLSAALPSAALHCIDED